MVHGDIKAYHVYPLVPPFPQRERERYDDIMMGVIAPQITRLHDCLLDRLFWRRSKKHQSSASLAFVRGIHRGPVNSPHKWPVTRKMLPFDDVIMVNSQDRLTSFTVVLLQKMITALHHGSGTRREEPHIINVGVGDDVVKGCVNNIDQSKFQSLGMIWQLDTLQLCIFLIWIDSIQTSYW